MISGVVLGSTGMDSYSNGEFLTSIEVSICGSMMSNGVGVTEELTLSPTKLAKPTTIIMKKS